MGYWVIYERSEDDDGWGAYLPDLPGCVATGRTRPEVARRIREAVAAHLTLMRTDGDPIPPPSPEPWAEVVEVDANVAGVRG